MSSAARNGKEPRRDPDLLGAVRDPGAPGRPRGEPGARRCMGTLVLDDLVDDPRVGGARIGTPGDDGRNRDDASRPRPPAADTRERQQPGRREPAAAARRGHP